MELRCLLVLLAPLVGTGQHLSLQLLQLLLDLLQPPQILALLDSLGVRYHVQPHGQEHQLFFEVTNTVKTGRGKSQI